VSHDVVFRLTPVLGENLQLDGGITMTFYLRGSTTIPGTVTSWISELKPDGTEVPVPGATIESPDVLNTATTPTVLGVGIIQYTFTRGSAILLHVEYEPQSKGSPLIVWDDSSAPTSLRLPAVSPTNTTLALSSQTHFGRVILSDPIGNNATVDVTANVSDAIGVYRFTSSAIQVTAPNGTVTPLPVLGSDSSDYATSFERTISLTPGQWGIGLALSDASGETYTTTEPVWVSKFYPVRIDVVDSAGNALENASVTASFQNQGVWSAATNSSGWVTLPLPSGVGALNLTVRWTGTETQGQTTVGPDTIIRIIVPVYAVGVKLTLSGIPAPYTVPVPFINVKLAQNGVVVANGFTGIDGVVSFRRIPGGNYTVIVNEVLAMPQASLSVNANSVSIITIPFPHRTLFGASIVLILALGSVVMLRKRRGQLYPTNFNYFTDLTRGGLPDACFVVIAGNSGSGKSVLLSTLAANHLSSANSIYVTNSEYPDRVRDNILKLGVGEPEKVGDGKRLIFIDAYSAVGGGASLEEFSVSSHTDLTTLSLNISKCLQTGGRGTDVYMDSLNPLITVLRINYVNDFLQSVAAKVKANNGRFCVTVGTGIEAHDLARLEETADCVIETQLQETRGGQRRRLRMKKMRGKPYNDSWTWFRVEQGQGIIFLTRTKPTAESRMPISAMT
jgi:KaiC/GvpD/RAD55 family RecA-like ATPase